MRLKITIILTLISFSFLTDLRSQTSINNAQAIFLYNFLSHFEWPEETVGNTLVIGVLGNTQTYDYLIKYTTNRRVGKKNIEVVQYNAISEIRNCQILLVASNKISLMSEVKSRFHDKSCLIVGEKSGSINKGAMVDFHIQNGKLRYKVDEVSVRAHKMAVSQQILSMSL